MPRGHVLPDCDTIATLRGEAGLTQQNLADRTGYGVRTISKIEGGLPTSSSTLAAIAIVLAETLGRPIHLVDLMLPTAGRQPRPAFARRDDDFCREHQTARSAVDRQLVAARSHIRLSATSGIGRHVSLALFADQFERDRFFLFDLWQGAQRSLAFTSAAGTLVARRSPPSSAAIALWAARGHVLRIALPATERPSLLQNHVEYVDAFDGPDGRQFHTHVVYPTDCLTFLIQFPEDRPSATLRGRCRRSPGGAFFLAADQPIDLGAGRMAYWRVVAPTPGETYELDWT